MGDDVATVDLPERAGGLLSVIVLAYHSGDKLERVVKELGKCMDAQSIPYEVVFIDDGSTDDTFRNAQDLEVAHKVVRSYRLSRNYTSHYAAFAGLTVAKGDCIALIPDDGQQPYETLVKAYKLWQSGESIVFPYREKREESWLVKFWSLLFYRLLNVGAEVRVPRLGLDTWFIDREVADVINERISPIRTTTVSEILRLGFDPVFLPYTRKTREGRSRWSWRKKLRLAADWFFSTSDILIKLIIWGGFAALTLSLIVTMVYIVMYFADLEAGSVLHQNPGWTSLFVMSCLSLGLLLLASAINAQYLLRVYDEVKGRPGFIIKKK
ncbi:glycosyltransferase [Flavobacteriales bacterium]|nr:glycosyltransferase [Flavobacteriales bacterium]